MPVERSAGIIIFRSTSEGRRYLVLRSSRTDVEIAEGRFEKEFWDLPKGVLEAGESGLVAARREAEEEAGVKDITIIEDFKETVKYFTRRDGRSIPKYVAMFLGKSATDNISLSWEHDLHEWLPYDDAYQRITLKPMKQALEVAEEYLNSM